ncbi:MAG: HAMP domain-containing sensor histidine kinase [Bacteroidota bacterium]
MRKYLSIYLNNDYGLIQKTFLAIALISIIGHPVYYVILTYSFEMTDSLVMRSITSILAFGLLYFSRETKLKVWQTSYYEIFLSISLPLMFTVLFIQNNFSLYWTSSIMFAALIFGIFIKPLKALILWPASIFLSLILLKYVYKTDLVLEILTYVLHINIVAYFLTFLGGIFQTIFTRFYLQSVEMNEEIIKQNEILVDQKEIIQNQIEELASLNATKDRFFSIIGHDLKSPLNSLMGLSDLLLQSNKDKDIVSNEKYIKLINDLSKRTIHLLGNLLSWSQSQAGKIEFLQNKINIRESINEVVLYCKASAQNKSINLTSSTENNTLVHADKNMLNTVLLNLITNAIKFTDREGFIIISTKDIDDDFIEISVEDTGIGVPDDIVDDIFRLDKKTTTKGTDSEPGSGLGLVLCKEFVDMHKGIIWVESKPGEGSKFKFTIPLWKDQIN